ncbi:MAG TPA: cytochrome C biosynthesis protein [Novosphingobium sp.]|nr:cytochrome C biosynthesis protein [Novosphingobium sp.]
MTWVLVGLLAVAVFAVIAFVMKAPPGGREALAAALVAGLAGYAFQAPPDLAGAPKPAAQKVSGDPAALVAARRDLDSQQGLPGDKWLVIGDGLARNGQFADAAGVMLGAVKANPDNAEAWLAIANALVAHADGFLTPASLFAFQRASDAEPAHPGPPFFLGLALAQSGRFGEARNVWAELLQRTPQDAPWRADLQSRLSRLEALMAQQGAGQ